MAFTGLHIVYLGGVHNPDHWASVFWYFYFQNVHSLAPSIISFAVFSAVVPYRIFEVRARLMWRRLSWWSLPSSMPSTRLIHWIEVLPLAGVYFFCHTYSQFIVRFHCGVSTAFYWRRACLSCLWRPLFFKVACLLSMLWSALFTSNNQTGCAGWSSCKNPVLILFYWQLSLVLSLLCRGEEVKFYFSNDNFSSILTVFYWLVD